MNFFSSCCFPSLARSLATTIHVSVVLLLLSLLSWLFLKFSSLLLLSFLLFPFIFFVITRSLLDRAYEKKERKKERQEAWQLPRRKELGITIPSINKGYYAYCQKRSQKNKSPDQLKYTDYSGKITT